MLHALRSLPAICLVVVSLYACGDDDTAPAGGTAADGGTSTSSSGGASSSSGGASSSSSGGSSSSSSGDSGTLPTAGQTFIKVDGVLQAGTATFTNTNNGKTSGIEIIIGSPISGSESTFLLQVHFDDGEKTSTGTFGTDAASTVEAQLTVYKPDNNPKKGLYVTKDFKPTEPNDITFTMNETGGNKLTFAWKGKMKINGGDTTIDAEVGGTDLALKQQN